MPAIPHSRRTDTASRLVAATPDAIYRAFMDSHTLMAWLPPEGMSGRALLLEPWAGGRYRIELTYEGEGAGKTSAKSDISAGHFLALEPGRRVVMSVEFESDDPQFAGEMIMIWDLESVSPTPQPFGSSRSKPCFSPPPAEEEQGSPSTDSGRTEGQTKVTLTAENVPSSISPEDHAAGLASTLENLARFVEQPALDNPPAA